MNKGSPTMRFTVNGREVEVREGQDGSLLDYLRGRLKLTGAKEACGKGHCGACSVIVDGRLVPACHTALKDVDGKAVTTIEGLGTAGAPHPIQRAFVEAGAVQCGYCTPGMVLATKVLLDANPHPSGEEIQRALNRNLCRCTGYVKIIDAVRLASAYLSCEEAPCVGGGLVAAERASVGDPLRTAVREVGEDGIPRLVVGRSRPREDAWEKAAGEVKFAADLDLPGACHVQVVRSTVAHARLERVVTREALAVPGVVAVLTSADVPGRNAVALFRPDQPVLAEGKVRYRGEPVALVVAETEEAAQRAADLVEVCCDPLPGVFSVEEAQAQGAPLVHEDSPNVMFQRNVQRGDLDAAFAASDVVLEGVFRTPHNEHAYMETEAGVAYLEGRQVVVLAGVQNAQQTRGEIAKVLGVAPERVRIIQAVTGGGFGGKLDPSFAALLALAAWVVRRPIRLVYSREESFLATWKRHPFTVQVKLGATADGTFTGLDAVLEADTGAYASLGPGVLTRAVVHASGPYRFEAVRIQGRAIYTNNPVAGAMRGFGAPQALFALESMVDELARALGLDPLEVRRKNGFRGGDTTATGQRLESAVAFLATLDGVEEAYRQAKAETDAFNASGTAVAHHTRRGVGLASMWFGLGKTSLKDESNAYAELLPDGRVRMVTTAADIGQGLETVMSQLAAEQLRVPVDMIEISVRDTEQAPDGGWTCASRQTYNTGNAVLDAARHFQQVALAAAGEMLDCPPAALQTAGGEIWSSARPERKVSFVDLYRAGHGRRYAGTYAADVCVLDECGSGVPYETYTYGTQVAEVEVDTRSGRVRVLRMTVAHDVGTPINPQAVEGQLEGGVVMGIGYTLKEKFIPGETANFGTYRVPRFRDVPDIRLVPVPAYHKHGPFGAAGAGECAQMPTAPAICSAVRDAIGVRPAELPLVPETLVTQPATTTPHHATGDAE